jgi:hypothetical protein
MTRKHSPEAPATKVRDDRWKTWVALALIALAIGLPVVGLMRYQGPPMEEGFMLAFPEQLLHGRLPHRDFLHLYGPGSLWLLAAVFKVFGTTLVNERLVGLAQHCAVAFGMFALLRPWGRRIATAAALTSVVILISPLGLTAMAWNGAIASGICGLAVGTAAARRDDADRWLRPMSFLAGLLGAVALLFRPDLIFAVGLGFGALWWGLDRHRRRPLAWGLAVVLPAYAVHVLTSGVKASFTGMFWQPVFDLRGGRKLPLPPSWGTVDGFLQRAGALRSVGWPLPMLAVPHQINLWFWMVPLSIVVILVAAWRLRRRQPTTVRAKVLWPAALFGAGLLPQALQRPDTAHLSWVTGITFALALPAMVELFGELRPRSRPATRGWVAMGIMIVILVGVIPFYPVRTYTDLVGQTFGRNRFGYPIRNGDRVFYFGDAQGAADAQAVVNRLKQDGKAGDRLIVGPVDLSRTNYSDAFFYYLFPDLPPGTRYIEMDPGIADAPDSGLASEVSKADWLILSNAWSGWTEPNDSAGHGSTAPNQVVRDHFCEVVNRPTFRLFHRCR